MVAEGQKDEAASAAPEGQGQEASSGREEPQTPLSPSSVPVRGHEAWLCCSILFRTLFPCR